MVYAAPGSACVDGLPCETALDCGDDSACAAGVCTCYKFAGAGYCPGCILGENCVDHGDPNPANGCEYCNPALNGFGWTTVPQCQALSPCITDKKCELDDECGFGLCAAGYCDCSLCQAKLGDPCDEDWECGVSGVCQAKTCGCALIQLCSGCIIGGICFGDGVSKPGNDCLACS